MNVIRNLRQMILRQLVRIDKALGRDKMIFADIVSNAQVRDASAGLIDFNRAHAERERVDAQPAPREAGPDLRLVRAAGQRHVGGANQAAGARNDGTARL